MRRAEANAEWGALQEALSGPREKPWPHEKHEALYGPHEDYCSETTAKRCFLDAGCYWLINERLIKHLSYY